MTEEQLLSMGLLPCAMTIPNEVMEAQVLLSNFLIKNKVGYLGGIASREYCDQLETIAISKQTFIDEAYKTIDYLRKLPEATEASMRNQKIIQLEHELEVANKRIKELDGICIDLWAKAANADSARSLKAK